MKQCKVNDISQDTLFWQAHYTNFNYNHGNLPRVQFLPCLLLSIQPPYCWFVPSPQTWSHQCLLQKQRKV